MIHEPGKVLSYDCDVYIRTCKSIVTCSKPGPIQTLCSTRGHALSLHFDALKTNTHTILQIARCEPAQDTPEGHRMDQTKPEKPCQLLKVVLLRPILELRLAQNGPEQPRTAQKGTERIILELRLAQNKSSQPRRAQKSTERTRTSHSD